MLPCHENKNIWTNDSKKSGFLFSVLQKEEVLIFLFYNLFSRSRLFISFVVCVCECMCCELVLAIIMDYFSTHCTQCTSLYTINGKFSILLDMPALLLSLCLFLSVVCSVHKMQFPINVSEFFLHRKFVVQLPPYFCFNCFFLFLFSYFFFYRFSACKMKYRENDEFTV